MSDGSVVAASQVGILNDLALLIENEGFVSGFKRLGDEATDPDREALTGCLHHILASCDVPGRSVVHHPHATPLNTG